MLKTGAPNYPTIPRNFSADAVMQRLDALVKWASNSEDQNACPLDR
jgi:hypothetical protein